MADRVPAEVFPPGEFLREELEARGWTQADLAEILGRPTQVVNEIVLSKRSVTPETAKGLGIAFGTGAQFWLNLEAAYQLSRVSADDTVARRARLYELAPVRDMIRRGWIEPSENVGVLEKRILKFLDIDDLGGEPVFFSHAARKSTPYGSATPSQCAWLFRARHLAAPKPKQKFSDRRFDDGVDRLRAILPNPEELRHVPNILSEMGIRFVVVEPLPSTKIDGVCFWLNGHSPVVAVSLRYDRIDWFWHTLMHELAHVKNRDGLDRNGAIDSNLVGENAQPFDTKPEFEQVADKFAVGFSIPEADLKDFIVRKGPLYSNKDILGFARMRHVHPGVVVGQLQYRGKLKYSHFRKMLVRVRNFVTSTALTDGWGHHAPIFHTEGY